MTGTPPEDDGYFQDDGYLVDDGYFQEDGRLGSDWLLIASAFLPD